MRDSRRPSLGPALIVVGAALVIVLGGIALSFATGGWGNASGATGTTGSAAAVRVAGSPLVGVPATHALSVVASAGQPPSDISGSLVVPVGATVSGHEDEDQDLGTFDRAVYLAVDARPSQVVAFYRAEMPHQGWGLLPGGVAHSSGGTELYYERAGSDGYYWQVQVTVTAVTPNVTPALGGGDQTAPTSRLELDLVQVDDAD